MSIFEKDMFKRSRTFLTSFYSYQYCCRHNDYYYYYYYYCYYYYSYHYYTPRRICRCAVRWISIALLSNKSNISDNLIFKRLRNINYYYTNACAHKRMLRSRGAIIKFPALNFRHFLCLPSSLPLFLFSLARMNSCDSWVFLRKITSGDLRNFRCFSRSPKKITWEFLGNCFRPSRIIDSH